MKLVSDWRDAWRWTSVHILSALTVAPLVWVELPADLKSQIPEAWYPWIICGVAFFGLIGRVRDQP